MKLDDLRPTAAQKNFPEATARYADTVLGTETDERIQVESFAATPTNYGGDHVIRPTGNVIGHPELWAIREAVLEHLEQAGLVLGAKLTDKEKTLWDREVGAALFERVDMEPHQRFGEDAWTYLSVHLFPEFANWRFPGRQSQGSETDEKVRPRDRVLGGRRNVLFRVWFRTWVLGPGLRQPAGADPLGEDELDNIFGRPTISRNHEFAQRIVDAVYRNSPRSSETRRQAVRELLKEIRRKYSTVHFVALGDALDDELDALWSRAVVAAKAVLAAKPKREAAQGNR